jgi:hypothetical protein
MKKQRIHRQDANALHAFGENAKKNDKSILAVFVPGRRPAFGARFKNILLARVRS